MFRRIRPRAADLALAHSRTLPDFRAAGFARADQMDKLNALQIVIGARRESFQDISGASELSALRPAHNFSRPQRPGHCKSILSGSITSRQAHRNFLVVQEPLERILAAAVHFHEWPSAPD